MEEEKFSDIPGKALNVASRMRLSWFLNPEKELFSENDLPLDYRGLANQMEFQINDVRNFQRSNDPTGEILKEWEKRSDATLKQLLGFLKNMGRHDIIQDIIPFLEKDVNIFLKNRRTSLKIPVQVPEITSCRENEPQQGSDAYALTCDDVMTGECTYYDAYLCYAQEDVYAAIKLSESLQQEGFKIFLHGRDSLPGQDVHNTNLQLIKDRCRRMLILLTPDFLNSHACEFQASFASSLATEQRKRILIPVILSPCELPLFLQFVSKIDLTKPDSEGWNWQRLICSLRVYPPNNASSFFIPMHGKNHVAGAITSNIDSSNPLIEFPSSSSNLTVANNNNLIVPAVSSFSTVAESDNETAMGSSTTLESTHKKNKFLYFDKLLNRLKGKKNSPKPPSTHFPSGSISSSSNATSGFYSQNTYKESIEESSGTVALNTSA